MVVIASFLILIIPDRVNKVILVTIGSFITVVGAFLTGPSKLFGLPDKISLIRAGMIVSGIGKAMMQSYVVTYIIKSGQDKFREHKEEVERKVPLIIVVCFGIGAFFIPLAVSAIYSAIQFRSTLDILGIVFSVNAVAFTIHAVRNNWGRESIKDGSEGEEDQQRLLQKNDI